VSVAPPDSRIPHQPLHHLDTLWVQVAGSLCNLTCTHCFVSCGPAESRHRMMSRESVREHVAAALALGVKEVYFTGGEPFLHRDLELILADTLAVAPATVLTNGTLFTSRRIDALRALAGASRHSLELRVSFDAPDAEGHDRFRGPGSFLRTLDGLRLATAAGLQPIVTATRSADADPVALRGRYRERLAREGLPPLRIKLLPMFLLGREAGRSRPYLEGETLASLPAGVFDPHRLQCATCRAVTSEGVYVCPLLVDEPAARMGERLSDALGPFPLAHPACSTCWITGMSCANG
jgi:uncharacterized Fe-S cluster-containing radical SAM superfamily protein